ncbi:porin family protein [Flagellatimonas centrodinii]|uniref:outer membrane beta-barrel protein n=1 Tax=Flagellatimonas centrodinii TaxID=2806210 RepID=UPI001FEE58B7|nr:outer membrane beta-barrel protein [Flagellatimonas centrodinii]ULQ48139.1 porin family protein [Flagellatimonas centrodinii]
MKKIGILAPGIALAGSLAAFPAVVSANDGPGVYFGGGAGYYRLNEDDFLNNDDEFKDNRWSWNVHAGAQFNPVFSLEGGYVDFGDSRDGDLSVSADGTFAAALVHIPLGGVAPFAKIGQLWWDAELDGPGFLPSSVTQTDGDDTFYGFGVRFGEGPGPQLRLEYDRMALDDTDVDMASVKLQYRF